jgi:hypothetical protein
MKMIEQIEKAGHTAGILEEELRAAYSKVDPVTSILIMDLHKGVVRIYQRIKELQEALEANK